MFSGFKVYLKTTTRTGGRKVTAKSMKRGSPNYKCGAYNDFKDDIAVLKLSEEIYDIAPITLECR